MVSLSQIVYLTVIAADDLETDLLPLTFLLLRKWLLTLCKRYRSTTILTKKRGYKKQ